jgi:protoporphyrinogen oxidase
MNTQQRWAVLGGGLLGMTLALRLAQCGRKVTLYESAPYVGGLASAWKLGDVVWDRHYHVTLLSDRHLRSLLAELRLDDELRWTTTRTGFYTAGKLYSMSNAVEFLQFPPLGLIDKARLAATIFYASRIKDWKRLEQIKVADWLARWSGSRTFDAIWLPLLRAKLGENYHKASAAFIWSIIVRMYAARAAGMKQELFGYMPGGYARTLSVFERALHNVGVDIRYSHPARRVQAFHSGVRIDFDHGHELADCAVLTMAAPMVPHLCPDLSPGDKQTLSSVEYQGIICASLLLNKPLSPFYITNITEQWVPFTAVIEMSALVDRSYFGGKSLVYLPKYLDPRDPDFSVSDQDLQERFFGALVRMYPQFNRGDVSSFRVSRVKYVFPISTLNYSQHVPSMQTSIPNVFVVNSSQIVNGTLNANETVQLAERAARHLVQHSPGYNYEQESISKSVA